MGMLPRLFTDGRFHSPPEWRWQILSSPSSLSEVMVMAMGSGWVTLSMRAVEISISRISYSIMRTMPSRRDSLLRRPRSEPLPRRLQKGILSDHLILSPLQSMLGVHFRGKLTRKTSLKWKRLSRPQSNINDSHISMSSRIVHHLDVGPVNILIW